MKQREIHEVEQGIRPPEKVKMTLEEFLVLCQPLIEGYSFLSLIRASSVVNRQFTLARC